MWQNRTCMFFWQWPTLWKLVFDVCVSTCNIVCSVLYLCMGKFCSYDLRKGLHIRKSLEMCICVWQNLIVLYGWQGVKIQLLANCLLDLWGWWHVWSDHRPLRQSSREFVSSYTLLDSEAPDWSVVTEPWSVVIEPWSVVTEPWSVVTEPPVCIMRSCRLLFSLMSNRISCLLVFLNNKSIWHIWNIF